MKQTPTTDSEILIYSAPDGAIKIDVQLENDTVWLTQADMARLFKTTQQNISQHLQAIYEENELSPEATYKKILLVRKEGNREVRREIEHYNLDAIISVGYRVKSRIATEFRIWATQKLKEYIVKGFALNDERFKSGSSMNYFTELQERIREIRLSERFFYQKIKDIYTTSIDYDPNDEKTREFFKIVQNKLLWAISNRQPPNLFIGGLTLRCLCWVCSRMTKPLLPSKSMMSASPRITWPKTRSNFWVCWSNSILPSPKQWHSSEHQCIWPTG